MIKRCWVVGKETLYDEVDVEGAVGKQHVEPVAWLLLMSRCHKDSEVWRTLVIHAMYLPHVICLHSSAAMGSSPTPTNLRLVVGSIVTTAYAPGRGATRAIMCSSGTKGGGSGEGDVEKL